MLILFYLFDLHLFSFSLYQEENVIHFEKYINKIIYLKLKK